MSPSERSLHVMGTIGPVSLHSKSHRRPIEAQIAASGEQHEWPLATLTSKRISIGEQLL